jgi:predicted dehydrogenase/nucleoside-diphosphate-sugar epimerase
VSQQLRIAVVGAGKMGRHHALAVRRLPEIATLAAVADSSAEYSKSLGEELGVPWYTDIDALMREVRPDVVHVVTPPGTHARVAAAAIEGGAHIYVEKPFAESSAEAEMLLSMAAAKGRQVCAGHQLLFERPTLLAAELVPYLGDIVHVESYFAFRQARRADGRTPLTAEGQLLDILPHPVYLLVHFLGADAPDATLEVHGLRADARGEVRAIVSSGSATGMLTVTLSGRPVDSYVKVVGTRGSVTLDFVRGIVVPQLGAGSTIDKILDPFGRAWTLSTGSAASLGRRLFKKQRSYPGLAEAFAAFYAQTRGSPDAPVPVNNIRNTVALCDVVRDALSRSHPDVRPPIAPATVAVTGGTGMLGQEVVRSLLERGETPLVLSRRVPPPAEHRPGVHYAAADLGAGALELPPGIHTVVHCAAETAGGWEAHERNSIDATRNVLDAMAASGIKQLVHVSSLAVIDADARQPLTEASPLEHDGRRRGPYVWGKLESERIAAAAPETHGISVRIVRPGALIPAGGAFEPPGKLGRALGGMFVAMGSPSATIPICDVDWAGEMIGWIATHFAESPSMSHAINPTPATRRELIRRCRAVRPGLRVVWYPTPLLALTSWTLTLAQRIARPGKTPVDLRSAFTSPRCDTTVTRGISEAMQRSESDVVYQ